MIPSDQFFSEMADVLEQTLIYFEQVIIDATYERLAGSACLHSTKLQMMLVANKPANT
jgi:hypothetical protein